jgi:hypothetical protein
VRPGIDQLGPLSSRDEVPLKHPHCLLGFHGVPVILQAELECGCGGDPLREPVGTGSYGGLVAGTPDPGPALVGFMIRIAERILRTTGLSTTTS